MNVEVLGAPEKLWAYPNGTLVVADYDEVLGFSGFGTFEPFFPRK